MENPKNTLRNFPKVGLEKTMANGVYIAVSGAQAELRKMDVVSNNLANANTPGFKKDRVNFREVLASTMIDDSKQDRRFVEVAGTHTDLTPGELRQTGNPLDLAVVGEGFFQVQTDRGPRLTRGGAFMQRPDGKLMTTHGSLLLGADMQPIQIPTNGGSPVIDGEGVITVGKEKMGVLSVVKVKDPTNLRKEESGLFATPMENVEKTNTTQVQQGYIEHSNQDSVRSMIELVSTQRHYDALHRAIETYKELDMKVTRIIS